MEKIFEINIITASFAGIILGCINGYITGFLIRKQINSDNRKFLKSFVFSFLYKLFFLTVSVWMLREKNVIIILLYSFFLIFFQIFIELFYLHKNKKVWN